MKRHRVEPDSSSSRRDDSATYGSFIRRGNVGDATPGNEVLSNLRETAESVGPLTLARNLKGQVVDEQGRRRFHGAFTGGFSAGYYNTVGSKEGWTPSAFVSSRGATNAEEKQGSSSSPKPSSAQLPGASSTRSASWRDKVRQYMDSEDEEEAWGASRAGGSAAFKQASELPVGEGAVHESHSAASRRKICNTSAASSSSSSSSTAQQEGSIMSGLSSRVLSELLRLGGADAASTSSIGYALLRKHGWKGGPHLGPAFKTHVYYKESDQRQSSSTSSSSSSSSSSSLLTSTASLPIVVAHTSRAGLGYISICPTLQTLLEATSAEDGDSSVFGSSSFSSSSSSSSASSRNKLMMTDGSSHQPTKGRVGGAQGGGSQLLLRSSANYGEDEDDEAEGAARLLKNGSTSSRRQLGEALLLEDDSHTTKGEVKSIQDRKKPPPTTASSSFSSLPTFLESSKDATDSVHGDSSSILAIAVPVGWSCIHRVSVQETDEVAEARGLLSTPFQGAATRTAPQLGGGNSTTAVTSSLGAAATNSSLPPSSSSTTTAAAATAARTTPAWFSSRFVHVAEPTAATDDAELGSPSSAEGAHEKDTDGGSLQGPPSSRGSAVALASSTTKSPSTAAAPPSSFPAVGASTGRTKSVWLPSRLLLKRFDVSDSFSDEARKKLEKQMDEETYAKSALKKQELQLQNLVTAALEAGYAIPPSAAAHAAPSNSNSSSAFEDPLLFLMSNRSQVAHNDVFGGVDR